VGPRTALSVLSGMSVGDIAQAVTAQDAGGWSRCPASARRRPSACCWNSRASSAPIWARRWALASDAHADIQQALVALGYSDKEAALALKPCPRMWA
jgi:Holliday junction DNA helicase RuvA